MMTKKNSPSVFIFDIRYNICNDKKNDSIIIYINKFNNDQT